MEEHVWSYLDHTVVCALRVLVELLVRVSVFSIIMHEGPLDSKTRIFLVILIFSAHA